MIWKVLLECPIRDGDFCFPTPTLFELAWFVSHGSLCRVWCSSRDEDPRALKGKPKALPIVRYSSCADPCINGRSRRTKQQLQLASDEGDGMTSSYTTGMTSEALSFQFVSADISCPDVVIENCDPSVCVEHPDHAFIHHSDDSTIKNPHTESHTQRNKKSHNLNHHQFQPN